MARASRKSNDQAMRGGLEPTRSARLRAPDEARTLRAVEELRRNLADASDVDGAVRLAVRQAAELLRADDHCAAVITPGVAAADLVVFTGAAERWDGGLLAEFARGGKPELPASLVVARLRRRDRPWGAIAVRWDRGEADWDVRHALTRFAAGLNDVIARIDRERIADVRARIDRKVMEQLRSRDLFYQVLDGLRSLARYDHTATLLIGEGDDPGFEIVAEKLAWRRGKSRRVGSRIEIDAAAFADLEARGVTGFRRGADGFTAWDATAPQPWIDELVARPCSRADDEPAVGEMLVAALATRDGLRAILLVAAVHDDTLGPYEAALVQSFLPPVSVALQNSRRAEALEARMMETERRHAMADLARGVAHDVNNALGAVVPLLQQIREDVDADRLDPATLREDLLHIDQAVVTCRDIFGGMLRFARAATRPDGTASVAAALEMCELILADSLRRRGVEASTSLPRDLPEVALDQAELQQILLNLWSNGRDAMPDGGRLTTTVRTGERGVEIVVQDTGAGIAPHDLPRVLDPFFTTKDAGTGLGLSICRSIAWRAGGSLVLDSTPGAGTTVTVALPAAPTPGDAAS